MKGIIVILLKWLYNYIITNVITINTIKNIVIYIIIPSSLILIELTKASINFAFINFNLYFTKDSIHFSAFVAVSEFHETTWLLLSFIASLYAIVDSFDLPLKLSFCNFFLFLTQFTFLTCRLSKWRRGQRIEPSGGKENVV